MEPFRLDSIVIRSYVIDNIMNVGLQMFSFFQMEPVSKFNPTVELPPVDDKEDEDMLAACINIGMQHNNRF